MNKLEVPNWFNDHQAIENLSNNNRVASFPSLKPFVEDVRDGYAAYVAANGDATVVRDVILPGPVRAFLRGHYAHPPSDVSYIDEIRKQSGVETCPMCGSKHSGTLDHVFPKEDFACFSIFGLNLVPACKCNSLRGRALLGASPGERVLHPYFDDLLSDRLVAASFEDLGAVPKISLIVLLDEHHASYAPVSFHVDNILLRTQVLDWLHRQWVSFVRKPGNVIRDLRSIPADHDDLLVILQDELDILDEYNGSKNNWESIFVAGLLGSAHTSNWVFNQLSRAGRHADDPLLDL